MKNEYGKNYENNKERLAEFGQSAVQQGEQKVEQGALALESQVKQSQHKLSDIVTKIDKQLRDDPWPMVIGVGVGGILLGTILGTFKKN